MNKIEDFKVILEVCSADPYKFFLVNPIKEVLIRCHPDKWPGEEDRAKHYFQEFSRLHDESSEIVGLYRVASKLGRGDVSDVYKMEKDNVYYVLKKPYVKAGMLLKKESSFKETFDKFTHPYDKLVPKFIESFDGNYVYNWLPDLISGSEVIAQYKDLDTRHIVWMTKRALMVLGAVHSAGLVNGAITPDHLLFGKKNHGALLTGWIHSGKIGENIGTVPSKWKHYYPKFAVKDKKLSPELDIYMLGRTMLDIGGRNMHVRFKKFFESLTYEAKTMISNDCFSLHEEVDNVSKMVFGARKFVELA